MSEIEDFNAETQKIIDQIDRDSERAVKEALRRIDKLRRETYRTLSRDDVENNIPLMRTLQSQIDNEIARLNDDLNRMLREHMIKSFNSGVVMITNPLAKLDKSILIRRISEETLTTSLGFSADLIKGVTNEAREKINGVVRRMVLGGVSRRDAQREIGRSLPNSSTFKTTALRAEAIMRTEGLRIQSTASHEQMKTQKKEIAVAGYEMRKWWLAAFDLRTRLSHRIAGIRYRKAKAIALDDFFIVGGAACLYPRDPALPAREAVNCRCVSVPTVIRTSAVAGKKAA